LPDELQALAEEVSKGVGRGEVKKKDSPSDAADKPAGAGSVSLSPPPSAPSPSDASPSTTQTDSTTRTSASTSPSNPSPLFAPSSSSLSSSSPSSTPPTLKAATSASPPEPDPESDSDNDFELSDPEDGEEDSSMLDMDEQMTMREATVEYYRLRDVLKAKGGLSGAMNGGGGLEEQEVSPLPFTSSYRSFRLIDIVIKLSSPTVVRPPRRDRRPNLRLQPNSQHPLLFQRRFLYLFCLSLFPPHSRRSRCRLPPHPRSRRRRPERVQECHPRRQARERKARPWRRGWSGR
jgi:hypothetical protein